MKLTALCYSGGGQRSGDCLCCLHEARRSLQQCRDLVASVLRMLHCEPRLQEVSRRPRSALPVPRHRHDTQPGEAAEGWRAGG